MDLTIICEFSEVSFSDNMILIALSMIFLFFFKRIWYIVTIFTEQILPLRRQNQLSLHEEVTVCRSEGMWHLQTARHAGSQALLTNPDDRLVSAHSTGSPGELPGPLQPCPGSNLAAESGSDPSKWPKCLEDMKNAELSASDIIFFIIISLFIFNYFILLLLFIIPYYHFILFWCVASTGSPVSLQSLCDPSQHCLELEHPQKAQPTAGRSVQTGQPEE